MLSYSNYINETFNKPYPAKLKLGGTKINKVYHSTFKTDDGSYIDYLVTQSIKNQVRYWDISFERRSGEVSSYEVTGDGDAFRIFATVIELTKEFIRTEPNAYELKFSAEKTSRESVMGTKSGSREKLYGRIVKRFAKQQGFTFREKKSSTNTVYWLSKEED